MSDRPDVTGTPRFEGVPVGLGGITYTVPPLSLGALRRLWPRIQTLRSAEGGGATPDQLNVMLEVLHAAIARNYPELTLDELAELVDVRNVAAIADQVMSASGITAGKAGPGAAPTAS